MTEDFDPMAEPDISVTVLTGFLGAGKTTLLNRILQENHGRKIAVIENELGEQTIDNDLLVQDGAERYDEQRLHLLYDPRRSVARAHEPAHPA
jgi:Ni2+-binding GTPase involved in maturation of urease and hydrogenase